jgi:RNA-directed DNA polymerase
MVQATIRAVIEPIFEREFAEHSYGFRIGRSAQMAIGRVEDLLKQGFHWVVDADFKGYFDSIPQDLLMKALRQRIADGRILELIEAYLKQGVMESGKEWTPTEQGTPQGAVLSPLLANLYLNPMDQLAVRKGWQMTRYALIFTHEKAWIASQMK